MKNKMKLLMIIAIALILVVAFIGYIKNRETVSSDIREKLDLGGQQRLDDPEIPKQLAKQLAGKEAILTEHLNKALEDIEVFLLGIRTAIVEGKVKKIPYGPHPPKTRCIDTSNGRITLQKVFGSTYDKIYFINREGEGRLEFSLYPDSESPEIYRGPHGIIYFSKNGTVTHFEDRIDGKKYNLYWDSNGKLIKVN
ncbi:MAG: hypothetical protein K9M75_13325 [Phycisphaerae bacterium]|nr:hypothetical protein [Phycisphaerae bacterium]